MNFHNFLLWGCLKLSCDHLHLSVAGFWHLWQDENATTTFPNTSMICIMCYYFLHMYMHILLSYRMEIRAGCDYKTTLM